MTRTSFATVLALVALNPGSPAPTAGQSPRERDLACLDRLRRLV